uniref:Golgi apparatus protein 1 n=1 Tax=Zooxanthella nutricula TaxID=1333877 RepID=A0A6U9KYV4_9DINO|mmetsp:Transcript_93875/g.287238  ORF Transcript_93875/g.287238 Transcript_93875/m.287238 type:complete len:1097 (+) Transcript_93875:128-3418(+)
MPPRWAPALGLWGLLALGGVRGALAEDIDPQGPCKPAIAAKCGTITSGGGSVAQCLRQANIIARGDKEPPPTTLACRREILQFFRTLAKKGITGTNFSQAQPVSGFARACAYDMGSTCKDTPPTGMLLCLKAHKVKLTPSCRVKVTRAQMAQARDFQLDVPAYEACTEELIKFPQCNVTEPPGETGRCLRRHRHQLGTRCRTQLFRRDVERAGDVRLNLALSSACAQEVKTHCREHEAGQGSVMKCLWKHSLERSVDTFSAECRQQVQNATEHKFLDYRLNYQIRSHCRSDIGKLCTEEEQQALRMSPDELFAGGHDGKSGRVIKCLKQNYGKMSQGACKSAVREVIRVHNVHWTANPVAARACAMDVQNYCSDARPGMVHQCLRKVISKLDPKCREVELRQGSLEAQDITLKPLLQQACTSAIRRFCADIPPGEARVLQCLQDKRGEPSFPQRCKSELEDDMEASSHDWRLKYGVHEQCQSTAQRLCPEAVSGAKQGEKAPVLTCLKQKFQQVEDPGCKQQLRRFIRSGIGNIKLAPVVYDKCIEDVQTFCSDVAPGHGQVHQCLMNNRNSLSQACAEAEFHIQALKALDVRMSTRVATACAQAMSSTCAHVKQGPRGHGEMWACLESHVHDGQLAFSCKRVVEDEMKLVHSEFHLNLRLVKHCAEEASSLCPGQLQTAQFKDFGSDGQVLTCLSQNIAKINAPSCKAELTRKAAQRVENTMLDPVAQSACDADVTRVCPDARTDRRKSECLRANLDQLSLQCRTKQKQYMVLESSDIRFSSTRRSCASALDKICKNVQAGGGRQWACLLENLHATDMDASCREALVAEQRKRAKGIVYNPILFQRCKNDLEGLVAQNKCKESQGEGWKILCLNNNFQAVKDARCKSAIRRQRLRESSDIRATPGAMRACSEDIARLCPHMSAGAGSMHSCLRSNLDKIQNSTCKSRIQGVQRVDRLHAGTNFQLRRECVNEISSYCKGVSSGNSRLLKCLGMHRLKPGFSASCDAALNKTALATGEVVIPEIPTLEGMLKETLQKGRSVWDRHGSLLLAGTVGFFSILAFACSYYIIHRSLFAGYGVMKDVGTVEQEIVGKPCE